MLLSSLNLSELENRTSDQRWGAGTKRDRFLYRDSERWYKIWGESYLASAVYVENGAYHRPRPAWTKPHGFHVGLFTPDISAAFESFIHDDSGRVRGYVTRAGKLPAKVSQSFIHAVFRACVDSGWVYGDFCYNNVVEVDGALSLIDFDTHLTRLDSMDVPFEEKRGALRPHVFPEFLRLVRNEIAGMPAGSRLSPGT